MGIDTLTGASGNETDTRAARPQPVPHVAAEEDDEPEFLHDEF
jgi:hypothetical protein